MGGGTDREEWGHTGSRRSASQAAALQQQRQRWLLLRQFGPSALWFLFAKYPVVARERRV